jgi:hypothetical protein
VRALRRLASIVASRRTVGFAVALALAGIAGLAAAATSVVVLGPSGPSPSQLTVAWGDTLVFSNPGPESREVTIPRATVASPTIPAGGSWSYAFEGRAGAFAFRQLGQRSFPGTVVVKVAGRVSLRATPTKISFGRSVTLRGASTLAAHPVSISHRPAGKDSEWRDVKTLMPAADGSFSTVIRPEIGGRYRGTAAAGQLASKSLWIDVAPVLIMRLSLRRVPAGRLVTVTARVRPASAARKLVLEVGALRSRAWRPVSSRKTRAAGTAVFRWKAVPGVSRVRVVAKYPALAEGFVFSASTPVTVTGL